MPSNKTVVETAAEATPEFVFSQLKQSDVDDLDVTVSFEEEVLRVDVYVLAPDVDEDVEQIADDAALTARAAVDELFEETA